MLPLSSRRTALANPELGQKLICPNDQTKFYDLNRRPAVCPKCGFSFDPEEVLKTRRISKRVPDYEDEAEKPAPVEADADELEEEEVTPEIDEAADEAPLVDDDADADDVAPAGGDEIGVDFAEDEEATEEADDVPFLEDEDEDFPEDEIEGLPNEEDERER